MLVTPFVVWNYFRRSEKIATCTLCEAEMSYQGTTTNLRNHLRNKHPSRYIDNPSVTTEQKKQHHQDKYSGKVSTC